MKKNESGRTMVEVLSVLAIVGVLSVVAVWGYQSMMRKQKVDGVLHGLALKTVLINSAMESKTFSNKEELNKFLASQTTQASGYQLSFHASPDGEGFVSEITDHNGEPIKGKICRELITKMADQKFVSDVDFTLKNEEKEDGTRDDITVRLKGQYVNLNAVCGG